MRNKHPHDPLYFVNLVPALGVIASVKYESADDNPGNKHRNRC